MRFYPGENVVIRFQAQAFVGFSVTYIDTLSFSCLFFYPLFPPFFPFFNIIYIYIPFLNTYL